jgi:hypothetical protein
MSRIVADPGVSAHGLALALEDLDRHTAGSLATDRRTSMVCLPACLPSSSVPFGTPSSENSLPGTIHYTALKTSHACLQHPQPLLDLGQPRTPSPVDVRLRTRNRDLLLHSRHFGRTSRPPSRAAESDVMGRRELCAGIGAAHLDEIEVSRYDTLDSPRRGFPRRFVPPSPFHTTMTVFTSPGPVVFFNHSRPWGLVFPNPPPSPKSSENDKGGTGWLPCTRLPVTFSHRLKKILSRRDPIPLHPRKTSSASSGIPHPPLDSQGSPSRRSD